jgi:hypothetical protein
MSWTSGKSCRRVIITMPLFATFWCLFVTIDFVLCTKYLLFIVDYLSLHCDDSGSEFIDVKCKFPC